VKHKPPGFFYDLKIAFINNEIDNINGLTLESFLYFLSSSQDPVCVVVDRQTIERVSVLLQENVGEEVACLLEPLKLITGFDNFYNNISKTSIQALFNKQGVSICFVEDSMLHLPCFNSDSSRGFKVNKESSFNAVVAQLSVLGFIKKDVLGCLSAGEFMVNGGVVDIILFDSQNLYRISFLDDWCSIYIVNPQTNKIDSSVKTITLFPFIDKKLLSPLDFLKNKFCFGSYRGGVFAVLEKKQKKPYKINTQVIDYQLFNKKHKKRSVVFIPFSCERGFLIKGSIYIPYWFKQTNKPKNKKTGSVLDGLTALNIGSIYVHEDFGLCQFLGLEKYNKQERVCLRFLDGVVKLDVYYLSKLSFYSDNKIEKLNYLNKPALWKKQKEKAEQAASEYVFNMVNAYANREGFLSKKLKTQDLMISDFVNNFQHQDTVDQSNCWLDILKDLGEKTPMNRLVCGDVGFGKTEIVLRAAFVSVFNNQQVVVLAPTTILANQLYHSFVSRLSDWGAVVGLLSGLSLKKELVVKAFLNKKIDIIIGTSSLLFRPDILKQCGLFVVDEEHRFGVRDKELVLSLNPSVNFLSLSATPIPRSMQLSLNNVRSLSLIQTPPVERKPIISFVHFFDLRVVCGAILKEINRGGQIFFVDNSVDNLKKIYKIFERELPFVSLGLIYSRLNKKTLVNTMDRFIFGKTQLLLSTSIIESGIDIGLANTIIINNAHLFGLSQLYQLRGRVGRSGLQAFAWFLIPNKAQTLNSQRRLKTIIKNTSLGEGYNIALSDLDIRGAGYLFGYKQSGEGGVGFEYYTKLISLAIKKQSKRKDCVVDIFNLNLSSVITNEGQRGYFYKSIFSVETEDELDQIKEDFIGLFGSCPKEMSFLLKNRRLGLLGIQKDILKIIKKDQFIIVVFNSKQLATFIDFIISYIGVFCTKNQLSYRFLNTKKNLTFQYKSVGENDYILLLSFINKLSF